MTTIKAEYSLDGIGQLVKGAGTPEVITPPLTPTLN